MAYQLAISPCIRCRRVFGYNPHRVPSTTELTGQREPVCETCMGEINRWRKDNGLEPFPILPGAYEEEEVP